MSRRCRGRPTCVARGTGWAIATHDVRQSPQRTRAGPGSNAIPAPSSSLFGGEPPPGGGGDALIPHSACAASPMPMFGLASILLGLGAFNRRRRTPRWRWRRPRDAACQRRETGSPRSCARRGGDFAVFRAESAISADGRALSPSRPADRPSPGFSLHCGTAKRTGPHVHPHRGPR